MTNMDMSEDARPKKRALMICTFAYSYAQDVLAQYNARASQRYRGDLNASLLIDKTARHHEELLRDLYGLHLRFDRSGRVRLPRGLPKRGFGLLLAEAANFACVILKDLLQSGRDAWPDGPYAVAEVIEMATRIALTIRPVSMVDLEPPLWEGRVP